MIKTGEPAPPFDLADAAGERVALRDLAGRDVVLYFYPKDDTPGCTTQACSLRDSFAAVTGTGVEVFGVSPDSVRSHVKFRDKYALPYRLLSDEGHRAAEAFGVWIEKSRYGRTYFGNERTSFIVGPDGTVEHVLPKVKPDEHVGLILEALAA